MTGSVCHGRRPINLILLMSVSAIAKSTRKFQNGMSVTQVEIEGDESGARVNTPEAANTNTPHFNFEL